MTDPLQVLLQSVADGQCAVDVAAQHVRESGFVDLGYAHVDIDRAERRGVPETILGSGKRPAEIIAIASTLYDAHGRVLITRLAPEAAQLVIDALPGRSAQYDPISRCLSFGALPEPDGGTVLIVSAGTSDRSVAAEAAQCGRFFGSRIKVLEDVGVAGIHRLLAHQAQLRAAQVLIVCAGMEGALPSVIAGLVARPVIAVPTSVGYGTAFGGITALLSMLTTCAAGITVVNIDNGFGAAYAARLMSRE